MESITADAIHTAEIQWQLTCVRFEEWLKGDVFRLKWWLLFLIFIISVYVWWKAVDKSRFFEIVLYMSLISIFALVLDELGEELCLWDYPTDIFPLFPPLSAVNIASLPVVYGLIYQYFDTWKKFIIASVIVSAVFSFILEPVLVLAGLYQPLSWKYPYGFPIYLLLAVVGKAVVIKCYSIKKINSCQK